MPKAGKRDRSARVRELCDFDESLVTRRRGDTKIPKLGQGDTKTRGQRDLYSSRAFSYLRPLVAGFDEAGRGALAGPVIVGCVHFPFFSTTEQESVPTSSPVRDTTVTPCLPTPRLALLEDLAGIDDSKCLTPRQRERLLPQIKAYAVCGVGSASAREIDQLGIVSAVSLAARRAYLAMGVSVDLLLCDRGLTMGLAPFLTVDQERKDACLPLPSLPLDVPDFSLFQSLNPSIPQSTELSFTRGDSRSLHIAAASILAKVTRDRIMIDLDGKFTGYGFAQHKGYGTAAHITALRRLGPSPIHRSTFHIK